MRTLLSHLVFCGHHVTKAAFCGRCTAFPWWFRQVMIMPRRTPVTARPSTLRSKRECKTFEEIKVSNALELVLWATDFD